VGFKHQTRKNMHGLGEGIVIMFGGQTTKPYQGFGINRQISFREEDAAILKQQIPEIAALSPEYSNSNTPMKYKANVAVPYVTGIYPVYADLRNIIPAPGGRFIHDLDMQQRRRVVFLGDEIKKLLFGDQEAVGQQVLLGQVPFLVIGVMQKKTQNSSYNARDQDRVFIPASTFAAVFGEDRVNNIIFKPADPTHSEGVQQKVREVLGKKYKFDPEDQDAIWMWDTSGFDKFVFYFFLGFNLFMGLIGSFTLIVGGIGVANIMYVVVEERTREIGIKRSVGAKRRHILSQFFLETFFIIGLGGGLGFAVAWLLIKALALLPIKEHIGVPVFSPTVAMVAMVVLGLVGALAGLFPARRAAYFDPVECLRY